MTSPPEAAQATSRRTSALDTLIESAHGLPSIPNVAVLVAKLVDNPNTSAAQVAKALANDQGLAVRVLRMANSAFYGAPRKISTVTDAIVLLGMQTIRNMTMAVSCYDVLDRELGCYAMRRGSMWRHSFCVGYAAELFARRCRYHAPEEAFVAGLLHDIGKVVISMCMSDEYKAVVELSRTEEMSFTAAEQQMLGFDHAYVGAKLAEQWKLPQQLIDAIRYHHAPTRQMDWSQLTAILHVADALCMTLGIGLGVDGLQYELEEGVAEQLNLSQESVEEVMVLVTDFLATSDLMQ